MDDKTGSEELAERIKELRRKKNLTQLELSQLTGISPSTIQKMETAKYYGRKDTHEKIAKALGVSFSHLISGKEDKQKSRIPDLPPDPPLEPELEAALNDPRLGKRFYSKQYLARLSNAELRQLALDALNTLKEIEDYEASKQ